MSAITYKVVSSKNDICQNKCPQKVHRLIKRFWKSRGLWKCDKAIVAYDQGEIIGFFRYNKEPYSELVGKYGTRLKREHLLVAIGTYILPAYRSRGVAKKLWARAIKQMKPQKVEVVITSRGGSKLVVALKKKYKKIEWRVIRNTY